MARRSTVTLQQALLPEDSKDLYGTLVSGEWVEGIKSRNGSTRLARRVDMESEEGTLLLTTIADVLLMMKTVDPSIPDYAVFGIYLNYYRDGNMYTPNHSHAKTHQLVISLGASRSFTIGTKKMILNDGDAILFGSSVHGVPKEPEVKTGRISIATFMAPVVSGEN